jgi:hypothetical protein
MGNLLGTWGLLGFHFRQTPDAPVVPRGATAVGWSLQGIDARRLAAKRNSPRHAANPKSADAS